MIHNFFFSRHFTSVIFVKICHVRHKKVVIQFRSCRPEGFCKKGVLRNFAKFKGKHLCQSLFFNKRPVTLLKKRLCYVCFPVNFAKFLRTRFLAEHLRWLLLSITSRSFSPQESFYSKTFATGYFSGEVLI